MDNQLLEHLLSFLTDRRKNLFEEVISKRTRHFTVVTEDVYQMHNTSAVMRLSDIVLDAADGYLKIPMYGFTESLNISVSAAIILQSVVTKLKDSDIDWKLSEDEKKEIILHWTKMTIKSVDQIVERFYKEKNL